MSRLFSPWNIRELTLPNRIMRSATWAGLANDDGTPTPELILAMAKVAEGGVGLVMSGFAFVAPLGKALPRQLGVHIDAMVGPLTRISDAIHKVGGRVGLQIVHAGGQTRPQWCGGQPLAPSAVEYKGYSLPAELTREQIWDIVEAFAAAAARARAAEFDAVQLHAAHGYLVNQFLSPLTNLREDEFGGELEGRARFAREVVRAMRQAVGPEFPLMVKLTSTDGIEGGFTPEEAVEVARWLVADGADCIEVSGGVPAAGKLGPARAVRGVEDEAYFLDNALKIKQAVDVPVVVVGGVRSLKVAEQAVEKVDAVAMCRPLIREPDLVHAWREGRSDRAECISCNGCFKHTMIHGLGCAQLAKED